MVSEAKLTKPTDLCPHPEWWHTQDGMTTETEVSLFIAAFVRAVQPNFVVEVGSGPGATTHRIATIIEQNGHGRFVTLELDPTVAAGVKKKCDGLPVEVIVGDSLDYTPDQPIDFLFVDGAPDRYRDVRYFAQFLAPRALVLVHDVANRPYSAAVSPILDFLLGTHIQLNTPRGLLIVHMP